MTDTQSSLRAPRVSIVLPTFNRPALLDEAIASVARQTWADWELIVVDDASEPPVVEAELQARFDARIHVIRHPASRGGAAGKNTGARAARGEIISFLDDDDLWAPNYLAVCVEALRRHPEIDLFFVGVTWIGDNASWAEQDGGPVLARTLQRASPTPLGDGLLRLGPELLCALLRAVPMPFQRYVFRRRVYDVVGPFREGRILVDSDWAIRVAGALDHVGFISEGLYLQRVSGQSYISRGDRELDQLLANAATKETLLERASKEEGLRDRREQFRTACADIWFDIAYLHHRRGSIGRALQAFRRSMAYAFVPRRLGFLARLALVLLRPLDTPSKPA